jgi:DNA-binding beta-propeller fold protein YncE
MGNVFVAETGNNRVQKFTSEGVFLMTWGSFGNGDGQFRHNHGLAVDDDGNVFVADRNQNRVQKFTSDGIFIMAWGAPARETDSSRARTAWPWMRRETFLSLTAAPESRSSQTTAFSSLHGAPTASATVSSTFREGSRRM